MDPQLLNEANFALSKCARPTSDAPGGSVVCIPKGFMIQATVPAASRPTFSKTITGDATWALRSIQIYAGPTYGVYWQLQLPNGRFLQSGLQPIWEFAGQGSWRFTLPREVDCLPGSKLQVTLDSILAGVGGTQNVIMLFEGVYKYFLDSPRAAAQSENGPRYLAGPNQNILAPCWMSGEGPETPAGYVDSINTLDSTLFTATIGGALAGTVEIDIDSDIESFEARRLITCIQTSAGVTGGTFLAMVRAGTGYALTSDYMDIGRYLQNSPWAHDWHIIGGDKVYVDLQFVDGAGAGTAVCQVFLEGVKRRRV